MQLSQNTRFEILFVKINPVVWAGLKNKHTINILPIRRGHAPKPIWSIECSRPNHLCQILYQSVKGFLGDGSNSNSAISYTYSNDPYNSSTR